ncbi:MAG TPA: UbiA family prenyltransferase [Terriglobales bacterium]|nr:UbiA family prenyltransferase [Terriglobales bacterium]
MTQSHTGTGVSPARTCVQPQAETPLYVDLDGTLLASDALWELLLALLKAHPFLVLWLPIWLLRGKAHLKQQLAAHATLNAALLPYRAPVLEFLQQERRRGREVVLATASDRVVAEAVAHHLGLFSAVLASDGRVNLSGPAKLAAIRQHARGAAFDYVGNSSADVPIWRESAGAILVQPSRRVERTASREAHAAAVLQPRPPATRALSNVLRSLRVHQWAKNVLLFVPLLLAHRVNDGARILHAFLAFVAFDVTASAVYIVNDLLDLDSDRQHPHKRSRPLAAGEVAIPTALMTAGFLLAIGALISATQLPVVFSDLLLLYVLATSAYSLAWKRVPIVDVLVLTGLYTVRVLAGAAATSVPISPWFLAFSMFFFLSLAFVKRYSELRLPDEDGAEKHYLKSRGYVVSDAELIRSVGPTSGYLAVLVLALYINNPDVQVLYSHPAALWLIGPLLLYWLTRVWLLAHRGELHGDPVVFALTDRISYLLAATIGVIVVLGAVK